MKQALIGLIVVLLLALDWAALNDITTGNEQDYLGEYAVLILSVLFSGFLILKRRSNDGNKGKS